MPPKKPTNRVIVNPNVRIELPPLYPLQQEIKDDPHRFKVIAAGRRFGKSTVALDVGLDAAMNEGKIVWFISPTYNNVQVHWRNTKRLVGDLPTYKNEQQKYLEFNYGDRHGSIAFKSGDRLDNLLGVGLDMAIIDEAAYQRSELWYRVVRPALSDKNGKAVLISSPNGVANWFYSAYLAGLDDAEPEWMSWRYRTIDNPKITAAEVEAARRDLPDLKFRQEYLAEFVSDAGGVFRKLEEAVVLPIKPEPEPEKFYIAGVDWGRKNDFTVVNVFDTDGNQVYIDRFTEIGFQVQRDRIRALHEKFKFKRIYVEANAMGAPNVETLQAEGLPVEAVYMTNPLKTELVERLSSNIERGIVKLITTDEKIGQLQLGELQSFTIVRTHSGLGVTYAAPRGWHDDLVVSLMLVNMGLSKRTSSIIQFAPNPFYGGARIDPIQYNHEMELRQLEEQARRLVNK